jgi:hypothetical protein
VSRGLGPQQRAAIALMRPAIDGLTVADLAPALGVGDRRCRAIVASLVGRGMAVVTYDQGGFVRAWNPRRLESAEFERDYRQFMLRRTGPITCEQCGHTMRPQGGNA